VKLNLGVRSARYVRFAAAAKTMADVPTPPDYTGMVATALALQLANQTGKFETIN
jgi:hypothetical protein